MKKIILLVALFVLSYNLGFAQRYTWTERTAAGSRNWRSVASSFIGAKLVAVATGFIYTSNDSGTVWVRQTSADFINWNCVASAFDGTKLVAGTSGDYLYTSTNSGVTWAARFGSISKNWNSVASSSDGSKLAAAVINSGNIYTSTNSGANWTAQTSAGSRPWNTVVSSTNGAILAATHDSTGYIYTSDNSGITWTARTSAGARLWKSVASSSDGTTLVAANANPGYIYVSADSGATWTAKTSSGSRYWTCVATSSDGTIIVAADGYPGYIYISTNSGASWTTQTTAGSRLWKSIALSTDGKKVVACVANGYLYTGADIPYSIATPILSNTNYCQNSAVSIPFTALGVYDSSNIFTAQLSDSTGSFTNPIAIGTLKATTTGAVIATIPLSITPGNAYKVRVFSNSPAITGTPNAGTITILAAPAQFTVTGGGGYCIGDTGVVVGLGNSQLGKRYQLQKNGIDTLPPYEGTGLALSFGIQTDSGTYSVIAIDTLSRCSQLQGSVTVRILSLPTIYDISGGGSYCEGEQGVHISLTLSQPNTTYRLMADAQYTGISKDGTGTTIDFGLQTKPGAYSVEAVNKTTNCTVRMKGAKLVIKNARPPQPTILKNGNELSSSSDIGNQWYLNTQVILGATSKTYTPTTSGKYSVMVQNNTCASLMSASVDVILDIDKLTAGFNASITKGDAPFTVAFTDATSGNPTSWSWDFGDTQSSTKQNPTHTYTTPGNYTVKLTASNAATNDTKSKEGFIIVQDPSGVTNDGSGSSSNTDKKIVLQSIPNPVSGEAVVSIESSINTTITLCLYNLLGNKTLDIYDGEIKSGQTDFRFTVTDSATGAYYLLAKYPHGTAIELVQVMK